MTIYWNHNYKFYNFLKTFTGSYEFFFLVVSTLESYQSPHDCRLINFDTISNEYLWLEFNLFKGGKMDITFRHC